MRRVVALLAGAVALGSLGGAPAAPPINWASLPYYDASTPRLRLFTDASWRGARVVNAGSLNPQPDSSWPRLKPAWIWAAACGPSAQRVSFSKTVLVPGVPYAGYINLYYGPGNPNYGGTPYTSGSIQVNGVELARLGDIARFPKKFGTGASVKLTNRMRKAFRHGPNTVTIRVDRAALKKGEQCTKPVATSGGNVRYVAVKADLLLEFAADLRALPATTPSQVKKNVKSGDSVTLSGTVPFGNAGPSTSIGGTLRVAASGDGQTRILPNLSFVNAPLVKTDCTFEESRVTCKYRELPVGKKLTMQIVAVTRANTGFFRAGAGKLTLMWDIGGPGADPGPSPNLNQTVVIMCAVGATDPACA